MNDALCFWVICDHPSDFPEHFTMRRQYVTSDALVCADIAGLYNTIEEARFDVPDGLFRMPRDPFDDPVIVESWF